MTNSTMLKAAGNSELLTFTDSDSGDSPQGPGERRSTADLTHARILQLSRATTGAATVTNTLDNEGEPQTFAEANKTEAWMDLIRKLSSLINNQTWTLDSSHL